MILPDPCCFLVVFDLDDGFATAQRCGEACPAGTVPIDPWSQHGHSCGDRPTCRPPAVLRVRGRALAITWDDETVPVDGAYHQVAVGRESPHHLVARADGEIVWQGAVVVRHGGRYTLDLTNDRAPRLFVDGAAAK